MNAAAPHRGGRAKLPLVTICPLVCKDCQEEKPPAEFPVHNGNGRPRSYCYPCFRARQRASYQRHRTKRLADMKAYAAKRDPEERRNYHRNYYRQNYGTVRPALTEAHRARRERLKDSTDPVVIAKLAAERERKREYERTYYRQNRAYVIEQARERRRRLREERSAMPNENEREGKR